MSIKDPWKPLPTSIPIALADAREGDCRWPLGNPASAEFRFCGAAAITGRSYCVAHGLLSVSYGALSERKASEVAS
jgi:GcrA cell cycle regulator